MTAPIIKWAGGKRQLLPQVLDALGEVSGTYYEPFLGGGAVFFALAPCKAVLNDINPALAGLYQAARDAPEALMDAMREMERGYNALEDDGSRRAMYNGIRDGFNGAGGREGVLGAARLVFLNKCGYNGLYRENSSGGFNTPWGKYDRLALFDEANLREASEALSHAKLMCGDFEDACRDAEAGDAVFLDSPYDMTFDSYTGRGFPREDHERLAHMFRRLTDKGVRCVLTNSDTPFIRELYGEFEIRTVDVKRMISCNGRSRTGTEVLVCNGVGI